MKAPYLWCEREFMTDTECEDAISQALADFLCCGDGAVTRGDKRYAIEVEVKVRLVEEGGAS